MTREEMQEQERTETAEFEAKTVAFQLHDGQTLTIAEARKLFDAVADPQDWRNPCAAFVPAPAVEAVCKAIEFYHGAKATLGGIQQITGKVLVQSAGYACW